MVAFWRICGRRCTRPTGWGSPLRRSAATSRVFVVDASVNADEDPRLAGFRKTFINARIYERSGEEVLYGEGCLSLPRLNEDVSRPERIRIRYVDEHFVEHDEEYDGFAAG